jgi:uncharacterized protein
LTARKLWEATPQKTQNWSTQSAIKRAKPQNTTPDCQPVTSLPGYRHSIDLPTILLPHQAPGPAHWRSRFGADTEPRARASGSRRLYRGARRYPEEERMSLVFEWDERKARTNLRKHRISFVEAASVFRDPLARIFPDEDHATSELREIIIGHSRSRKLLLVSFTEPARERIRIISARSATKIERYDYEENVTS